MSEELEPVRLPQARIRRIVKEDRDIGLISAATLQSLSASVQVFVRHFTEQAMMEARGAGRNRLLYGDFANAVGHNDDLEFLASIVPQPQSYKQIKEKRDQAGLEAPAADILDPHGSADEPDFDEAQAAGDASDDEEEGDELNASAIASEPGSERASEPPSETAEPSSPEAENE